MTRTIEYTVSGTLEVRSCWCGIEFAVPEDIARVYEDANGNRKIWCPLGHSMVPKPGYSMREKLQRAEAREQHLEDQLAASERSKVALRGHLTRLRNRIAAGVCPWCRRSFSNVMRHIHTKHPEHEPKAREAVG